MEISIREMAAIKRVNMNSKGILKQLEVKRKKLEKLSEEYETLVGEYKACESYVTGKWGYYSEQILSSEADRLEQEKAERMQAAVEEASQPDVQDEPVTEDTHVETASEPVWETEENTNENTQMNDNPFED